MHLSHSGLELESGYLCSKRDCHFGLTLVTHIWATLLMGYSFNGLRCFGVIQCICFKIGMIEYLCNGSLTTVVKQSVNVYGSLV